MSNRCREHVVEEVTWGTVVLPSLWMSAWLWELVRDFLAIAPVHNRLSSLSFRSLFTGQHFSSWSDVAPERAVVSHPDEVRELTIERPESVVGNWLPDLRGGAFCLRAIATGIWTHGCTSVLGSFSLTCIFVLCNLALLSEVSDFWEVEDSFVAWGSEPVWPLRLGPQSCKVVLHVSYPSVTWEDGGTLWQGYGPEEA